MLRLSFFIKLLLVIAPLTLTGWYFYNSYEGLKKSNEIKTEKIIKLESDLKLTREISEANLKKIKELERTIEVNNQSVSNLCNLNNEVTTRTNEVILNRRKREKTISQSYTDKTTKLDEAVRDFFIKYNIALNEDNQISETRINSLWESYCSNKECEDKK